jgi:hypothetical protein
MVPTARSRSSSVRHRSTVIVAAQLALIVGLLY